MAIKPFPAPPSRLDTPDVFSTRADEANALQTDVNNNQSLAQAASEAACDLSIANASGSVATGSSIGWANKTEDSAVISGKIISCTNTFTLPLISAATLGRGVWFF